MLAAEQLKAALAQANVGDTGNAGEAESDSSHVVLANSNRVINVRSGKARRCERPVGGVPALL